MLHFYKLMTASIINYFCYWQVQDSVPGDNKYHDQDHFKEIFGLRE